MNSGLRYSKVLHYMVLLSFFLPFYQVGCQKNEAVTQATATELTDSMNTAEISSDSLIYVDSLREVSPADSNYSSVSNCTNEDNGLSYELASKNKLFKILLVNNNQYTGIGALVDTLEYLVLFAVFVSFLLLILSIIAKYTEHKMLYIIIVMECLALIFLYISCKSIFESKKLYGYRITNGILLLLIVYDTFLLWKSKRTPPSQQIK